MRSLRFVVAVAVFAGLALAQTPSPAGQSKTAAASFEKMKSLVGEWEGTMNEGGKTLPATTSYRLVSDKSVLMNVLGAGTPYEMVTMFHMDGRTMLATHYCAAHNQPRFRLVSTSDPNVFDFQFKDVTNLSSPTAPHMVGVKVTLLDANHHYQDWKYLENGKTTTSRFDFHRKK